MSSARRFGPDNLTYGEDTPQNRERMRELMLFIADHCWDDANFGFTKLNKILYYCDFMAFAKLGKPITGMPYNKLQFGPVPTASEITREEMRRDEDIAISQEGSVTFHRSRIVPLRGARLDLFSGPEVALVDSVVESFDGANAKQLSELSHNRAWQSATWGEQLPYESIFVSDEPPTEMDIAVAHDMIAEYESFQRSGR